MGHSVEVAGWATQTDKLLDRMAGRFARVETRRRAGRFLCGLLADLPRKNCRSIAEHAGDTDPHGMQHLLARAKWDTDVAILRSALEVVAPDSANRARLLAVLAAELTWHPDHAHRIALAEEAVAVARRTGDPATVLAAILTPGPARSVPETTQQRVQLLREAADIADRANNRLARSQVVLLLAPTLLEAAHPDRLDAAVDDAVHAAAEIREPWGHVISLLIRCCLAIVHDDLLGAEHDVTEVLHVGLKTGQPDTQEMHLEPLYLIRWHQGRLAEILPQLRAAASQFPDLATRWAGLACAEAISGEPDHARALLHAATQRDFEMFYGASWLGCMTQWADVTAELHDVDAATILYRKLAPWKHLFATAGPLPVHAVSLARARLARLHGTTPAADHHFADAMRIHQTVQAPFGIAQTALYWGEHLLDRDPQHAQTLLHTATTLAQRHDFRDVKRRAHTALEPT